MLTKTYPLKDAGFEKVAAGEDTLVLINRFALRPLDSDEVYVRRMVLANDALDRDGERFSEEVLQHFAQTLPGKSFLVGHQHGSAPVGRFFQAEVVTSSEQSHIDYSPLPQRGRGAWGEGSTSPESQASRLNLVASFYTIKTKDNEGFRLQIDGGVYANVSIGFRCENLVCDICGKDMKSALCPHYPGKTYNGSPATGTWKGNAEALEASLVYLGAQFGAQFIKSPASCVSGLEQEPHPAPSHQDNHSVAQQATPQVSSLKSQVQGLEALLEQKERRIDELAELAEEGKILRSDIIAQILSKSHLVGLPSLIAPESLSDLPLTRLKSLLSDLSREFDRQFPPSGLAVAQSPEPKAQSPNTDLSPFVLPKT